MIIPANSSEGIYNTLKEEILTLALKPGQALSENELCARFGVSRTPVRSVLQRLKEGGLVDVVPYKGTTVTLLSLDEIEQRIYMRIAIESMVLRDFMDVCTPIQLEKVRYILRKQQVLVSCGGFSSQEFYALDSQLHELWFTATRKELLWEVIQRSEVNYKRFRMLDIVAMQNYDEITREHAELFDIIERRDKAAAEPLVRRHMYGGVNRLGERIYTEFKMYFEPFTHPYCGPLV